MAEMKKEYVLAIQFPEDKEKGSWKSGAYFDPMAKAGQKFYNSLDAARNGLKRLLAKFNREFEYGPDGKRRETHSLGGGFAADMILDKSLDDMNRIVAWTIKVREVTPWEMVEEG